MDERYSGTVRLADGTYVPKATGWAQYEAPEYSYSAELLGDVDIWVHSKRIWVHGRELSEYDKYLLDMALLDCRRSLPGYRAYIRTKRRRKIERKQKRAAFRRRKRGLA